MTKKEQYRAVLAQTTDWDALLKSESGLPGPRGNLELAEAVYEEIFLHPDPRMRIDHFLSFSPDVAPENTPEVYLAFCGVVSLAGFLSRRQNPEQVMQQLRRYANDPRWRIREAVAIALQYYGDTDMPGMLQAVRPWAEGTPYEKRAAAAAICEPRLLKDPDCAQGVLEILDIITQSIPSIQDRKADPFQTLRKGLAYCWSVAVAARPDPGKKFFEKWVASPDADIRWIMRENLKKNRLIKVDPVWVSELANLLSKTK
jgi:hypothetical protein